MQKAPYLKNWEEAAITPMVLLLPRQKNIHRKMYGKGSHKVALFLQGSRDFSYTVPDPVAGRNVGRGQRVCLPYPWCLQ